MVRVAFGIFLLLLPSAAFAQQASTPEFLQQAIIALQDQRNRALDALAAAQAQLALVQKQAADLEKALKEEKAKNAPPE